MPTICAIGPAGAAGGLPERIDGLRAAWPRHRTAPAFVVLEPGEALRQLEGSASTSAAARPFDACLVFLPQVDGDSYLLLDALQQAMIPGVVLVAREDGPLADMDLEGLLVQPQAAPHASIAAMLMALAHRQETVRALEQTVRVNQSVQGEAAAEINRLHDELLLASRVQREFLPEDLPADDEVEAAVIFRPAGFVSGDIYGVARLDEEHVGFFLADAMGHGVPAALMTLFIAANIPQRETVGEAVRLVPPGVSLARLNRDLCASRAGATRFATAVCGVINTRSAGVVLASAGHPPALRVSDQGVKVCSAAGTLLGVVEGVEYEEETFELADGEVLVLHSDGVELAFGEDLPGGGRKPVPARDYQQRLAAIRPGRAGQRGGAEPLAAALSRLGDEIDEQSGSLHQPDDVTIIALELLRARREGARVAVAAGRAR